MTRGYNWRNTLSDFSAVSRIMSGFCITFIIVILSGSLKEIKTDFCELTITSGNLVILFFGISAGMFVSASEFFIHSKQFDIYSIPAPYREIIMEDCNKNNINWRGFEEKQINQCRVYETYGRILYNFAIIIVFLGLFFAIFPYNIIIAIIITGFGIFFQIVQIILINLEKTN